MMNRAYSLFFMTLATCLMMGCSSGRLNYSPAEHGAQRLPYPPTVEPTHLYVSPIVDIRTDKTSTEGWSLFALVPPMPCMLFHNYDMRDDLNAPVELHTAIEEHLRFSGLKQGPHATAAYTIKPEIVAFGIDGVRTTYGAGLLPGGALMLLGVPYEYTKSHLHLRFEVINAAGEILLSKIYRAEHNYAVGLYYNLSPLPFITQDLAEIMNNFSIDFMELLEAEGVRKR